jgi:predicted metal-dependent phosphoesterase TrpH
MQVDVLAITDHDSVAAIQIARDYSQQSAPVVNIISGTEISTRWHGFEIHILGLNVNENDEMFLNRLASQQQVREQRAHDILEKLNKAGVALTLDNVQSLADGVISRGHFAQALVNKGFCSHHQQAFTQYLGKGKKAYVTPKWVGLDEAVAWIKEAGGQAVIAHPYHYDMTTKWLRRLAADFSAAGGEGMEVQHPNLAKDKQTLMIEIALEHDLLGSAGSDFHSPSRWTELGRRLELPVSIEPIWRDWGL